METVRGEQLVGEVVRGLDRPTRGELAAIPPVRHHLFGDVALLTRRGLPPLECLAVKAPALEHVVVRLREPEQAEHRLAGEWERQRAYELDRRRHRQHSVDQVVGPADDVRLQRLES